MSIKLRDYFAGQVLSGILAANDIRKYLQGGFDSDYSLEGQYYINDVCNYCYNLADKMIKIGEEDNGNEDN